MTAMQNDFKCHLLLLQVFFIDDHLNEKKDCHRAGQLAEQKTDDQQEEGVTVAIRQRRSRQNRRRDQLPSQFGLKEQIANYIII
jgi:hypothetical protein